jgi:hypothetical protein
MSISTLQEGVLIILLKHFLTAARFLHGKIRAASDVDWWLHDDCRQSHNGTLIDLTHISRILGGGDRRLSRKKIDRGESYADATPAE